VRQALRGAEAHAMTDDEARMPETPAGPDLGRILFRPVTRAVSLAHVRRSVILQNAARRALLLTRGGTGVTGHWSFVTRSQLRIGKA